MRPYCLSRSNITRVTQLGNWNCNWNPSQHLRPRTWTVRLRHYHDCHQTPNPKIRKISHAFDPVNPEETPCREHISISKDFPLFNFLSPTATSNHGTNLPESPFLKHVNRIYPPSLGVPWPTSFPGCIQSKYWAEAEEAARQFAQEEIGIFSARYKKRDEVIEAVVDAAVSFAVNVVPTGDLGRMRTVARVYVGVFVHDDAVESGNTTKNPILKTLAQDLVSQDPVKGKRFLKSILAWGSLRRVQAGLTFRDFEDYVTFRIRDVGAYPVFHSMEFASNLSPTTQDAEHLSHIRNLCAKHFALANDLYSYAKEVVAEQERGETLLNAVRVLQDLLQVSPSSAKVILRNVILDVEGQIHGEFERLVANNGGITEEELGYVRGLVAVVAGNVFYSATCGRYAMFIEGS